MPIKSKKDVSVSSKPRDSHIEIGPSSDEPRLAHPKFQRPGQKKLDAPEGLRAPTKQEAKETKARTRNRVAAQIGNAARKQAVAKKSEAKVHKQSLIARPRSPIEQANLVSKIEHNKRTTEPNRQGAKVSKHWSYPEHRLSAEVHTLLDTTFPHKETAARKQVLDAFGHHWRQAAKKIHDDKVSRHTGRGDTPHLHDSKYSKEGVTSVKANPRSSTYIEHYEGKSKTAKYPVHTPTVKDFHHEVNSHYELHPIGASNKKLIKDGAKQRLVSSGQSTSEIRHGEDVPKLRQAAKEHELHLQELKGHAASHEQDIESHRKNLGSLKSTLNHANKLFISGHKGIRDHGKLTGVIKGKIDDVRASLHSSKSALADTHKRIASITKKHVEAKAKVESAKSQRKALNIAEEERGHAKDFVKGVKTETGHSEPHIIDAYEKAKKAWVSHSTHALNKKHPEYKKAHAEIFGDPHGKTSAERKGIVGTYPKSKSFFTTSHKLFGSESGYHRAVRDNLQHMSNSIGENAKRLKEQGEHIKREAKTIKSGVRTKPVTTISRDKAGLEGTRVRFYQHPITTEDRTKLKAVREKHATETEEHNKQVTDFNAHYKRTLDHHAQRYEEHKPKDDAKARANTQEIEKQKTEKREARKAKIEENKKAGITNRNERGLNQEKGHGIMRTKKPKVTVEPAKIGKTSIKRVKRPLIDNKKYMRHMERLAKLPKAKARRASRSAGKKKR